MSVQVVIKKSTTAQPVIVQELNQHHGETIGHSHVYSHNKYIQ